MIDEDNLPQDFENVLQYHFYDYSKMEIIKELLTQMDTEDKIILYKEITTEE